MSVKLSAPLLFVFTVAASALAAPALPASVPVHWGIDGQPDRWGSPWQLLVMGPALVALVGGLFLAVGRLDPRARDEDDPRPRQTVMSLSLLLVAALSTVTLAHAAGWLADMNRSMGLALSLGLLVLGNAIVRVRPSWFVGIRTPWALSSDDNWRRTHRVGGRALFVAGLLGALAVVTLPSTLALPVVLLLTLAASGFAVVYSYALWRRASA